MRAALVIILSLVVLFGVFRPSWPGAAPQVAVTRSAQPRPPAARWVTLPMESAAAARCDAGPASAALANAASLETLEFAPFHRPETGWAVYAPRVAAEIDTRCRPATLGFAAALARWQGAHGLPATGVVDIESFAAMNGRWTAARPFVVETAGGECPPPPAALATARAGESYGGKTIQLRADALAAYQRLVTAARRQVPGLKPGDDWLRLFSGYRDPDADALRCAAEGNCQGVMRASCSAHRTGLAMDMDMGAAPGFPPDSSDDANRRYMVQTPVYRWMVRNAGRFGFVNYVFEPWHWEWRGNAALDSGAPAEQ